MFKKMPNAECIKSKSPDAESGQRTGTWKKSRGPDSPMTRLKRLWRQRSFPRAYWRDCFLSARNQSAIREEILKEFNIHLRHDSQLTYFRKWVAFQDMRREAEQELEEDCRKIEAMFPKATEDEIRQMVFKAYHVRALVRDDVELGKFVLRHSLAERKFSLNKKKACEADRSSELKALDLCLQETSEFPAARQLFRAAFAELRKQKAKASVSPQDQSEKTMVSNDDGSPQAASGNDGPDTAKA
jgi:hypothetical protein